MDILSPGSTVRDSFVSFASFNSSPSSSTVYNQLSVQSRQDDDLIYDVPEMIPLYENV